ncbi:MAG: hypothetical protein LBT03_02905 [Holosporales bacterium]|nr:hypothetical protein [Holosporales bacterium]
MKKFVIVALLGGIACGSCMCTGVGSRTEDGRPIVPACYDKASLILECLVTIYQEFDVRPGNPDAMGIVDREIYELARMADPLEVRCAIDLYFNPAHYFCPNPDDMEEEQKIKVEIIQRWKDLGLSSKAKNP